jgi:hypothetical protein
MQFFQNGIRCAAGALALAALCALAVPPMHGQSAAPAGTASTAAKKPVHHKRKKAKPAPEPAAEVPVTQPAPPRPNWPVNDPSQPAHVNWDGRQLTITAANASLSQILHEVVSATGLKVEGLEAPSPRDQRIYGSFGPAPARDVLSQLLDGSGYNSILIGDRGVGNPRELLLTAQAKGHPANAGLNHPNGAGNNDDEGADEQPEPPEQPEQPEQRPQQGPPPPGARPAQQYLQDLRNQQQQQQLPSAPGQTPQQGQPNEE